MIEWNGCWENRTDRKICRWMVAWTQLSDVTTGCIGGYSGGGCFQLEKFMETPFQIYIEAQCDLSDLFSHEVIQCAENCQEKIISFHEEAAWLDAENLILLEELTPDLVREGDMLSGGSAIPSKLIVLFEKVGLISNFKQ